MIATITSTVMKCDDRELTGMMARGNCTLVTRFLLASRLPPPAMMPALKNPQNAMPTMMYRG
ncbi:MAG: hypothetical protein U0Y82_04445 [Thermoleophilia bacterium]